MSRFLSSIESTRSSFSQLSIAGPSSHPFHSTSTILSTHQERRAPHKKSKVARKREFFARLKEIKEVKAQRQRHPDHVLGFASDSPIPHPKGVHGKLPPPAGRESNLWERSRLAKCIVHPREIWNLPVPQYEKGENPKYFLPGLRQEDKDMLFGALPHVSTAIKYDSNASEEVRDDKVEKVMGMQEKQGEMMMRIMDLRNASRAEINAFNRKRILEEFGQGWNHGDQICQAAVLTLHIRNLNEHILSQPKDIHNRRHLKTSIYNRAKILKYVRRTQPDKYDQALLDLGLDIEAVEGELIFRM